MQNGSRCAPQHGPERTCCTLTHFSKEVLRQRNRSRLDWDPWAHIEHNSHDVFDRPRKRKLIHALRIPRERLFGTQWRILAEWDFAKDSPLVAISSSNLGMSHGGGECVAGTSDDRSGIVWALEHRISGRCIWRPPQYETNPLSASQLLAPRCADSAGLRLK